MMDDPLAPAEPVADEAVPPLITEIARAIADPGNFPTKDNHRNAPLSTVQWQAAAVMDLLTQRGHVLPGVPPAKTILADAQSFAARLIMSNLALRILNMLAYMKVETPETDPARRWLDDYLEGRNHGPAGCPMLWPARLPAMAALLRDWGFIPTPTMPPYVARAPQSPLTATPAPEPMS